MANIDYAYGLGTAAQMGSWNEAFDSRFQRDADEYHRRALQQSLLQAMGQQWQAGAACKADGRLTASEIVGACGSNVAIRACVASHSSKLLLLCPQPK